MARVRKRENDKPLVWLRGEVKTPPFSAAGRLEAGYLLRLIQQGHLLGVPHSRPMPDIGTRCHELRINDESGTFRIIYRIDSDAVLILEVFKKKTEGTPHAILDACKRRLGAFERLTGKGRKVNEPN
jgi:phage-related protein